MPNTMFTQRRQAVVQIVLIVVVLLGVFFWTSTTFGHADFKEDPAYIVEARCPHYSPDYPSAGGPGCSPKCTGRANSSYGAVFYNHTHSWPKDLVRNMHLAATIVKKYGTPISLDTERTCYLHVTFDYYCCYTPEEAIKIGKFLNTYAWKPHEVWFDQMVCAINGVRDMVSIKLMLDENSEKNMLQWALDNERELEVQTGVHKRILHNLHSGFHMTLAIVNQSVFPVQLAVKEINKVIPPGTWHSTPVILHRPLCKRCEKLAMSTVKSGRAA